MNDRPSGVGRLVHPDGSVLLGTFVGDIDAPRGGAVLQWPDGAIEQHFYDRQSRLISSRPMDQVNGHFFYFYFFEN